MNPLGIGIIGYGRIGAEHAAWISTSADLRLAAVADPTAARRALAAGRAPVYERVDQLLENADVEAVVVSTPTIMHFEQAMAALRAGRHVMIEKPMAQDLKQSQAVAEAATAAKRVLSVFHNRRWDVDFLTAKQAIEEGVFGRIINVESRLHQWSSCVGPAAPEYRPNWRNEAAFGGGGLYDWGSHFLDQIWRLLWPARPIKLFAQLRGNVWSKDCDDFARICLNFDNGAVGLVEINTTTTRPLPRWHIDGLKGSAFSPYSPQFDTTVWASLRFSSPENQHHTLPMASPGLTETALWEIFARAIREGTPPAVKAESVLPTMAILDAARESDRTGQTVDLHAINWVY